MLSRLPIEIGVLALGLGGRALELAEDLLDPVERREDERDGLARDRHAVAELAHQGLGRMGQRLEARQAEEAAGALDGVDEAEDVAQDRLVVRVLLEADELDVDRVEMLARLGQELTQQIVHDGYRTLTQRRHSRAECRPRWVYDRLRSSRDSRPAGVAQAPMASALIVTSSPSMAKLDAHAGGAGDHAGIEGLDAVRVDGAALRRAGEKPLAWAGMRALGPWP